MGRFVGGWGTTTRTSIRAEAAASFSFLIMAMFLGIEADTVLLLRRVGLLRPDHC